LDVIARDQLLVFPVHPRTRAKLDALSLELSGKWRFVEPLGYHDFLMLVSSARLVLTDSGGIQEETTVLGVPCLTLRENTERPVTVDEGTNQLVGSSPERIHEAFARVKAGKLAGRVPQFWDGKAAERVAEHLAGVFV